MTAPAVVHRWDAERGRALVGAPLAATNTVLREALLRVRRAVPAGAALLTVLIAHVGLAPHLSVRGATPDVLLVAVVAVAAGRGPRAGAGVGFAVGLGADLFLATPLGTAALAFTVVGHVLGTASRRRSSSGTAGALCNPASTCFSCRAGRLQGRGTVLAAAEPSGVPGAGPAEVVGVAGVVGAGLAGLAGRPTRARRRAAARRAGIRRSIVLTMLGVAAGQLATTAVATALGGVPFPGTPHLTRIAAIAALSSLLGPLAAAAVRRLPTHVLGPR